MNNIIYIEDAKLNMTRHISGRMICLDCQHEWIGVMPIGTTWLECPECYLYRGRLISGIENEGPHLECECGNDLFYVTLDEYFCPNCARHIDIRK